MQRRKFTGEKYWTLAIEIQIGEEVLELKYESGKISSKTQAKKIFESIKGLKMVKVKSLVKKKTFLKKPEPMNSVDLISMASDLYGYDSFNTMKIAENLYTQGLISYPRTESRSYSENFDFKFGLKVCCRKNYYGYDAIKMIKEKSYKAKFSKELQDHPPITPVASKNKLDKMNLKTEEKNIFDLVVKNFYSSISAAPEFDIVDTQFSIGDLTFNERHAETKIDNEFKLIEHNIKTLYKLKLSKYEFKQGDPFYIKSVKLQKWKKAPQEYISESELIKQMEEYKIGTDGTIPTYVKKIEDRGFVKTEFMNGIRRLTLTPFGEIVAELYLEIHLISSC